MIWVWLVLALIQLLVYYILVKTAEYEQLERLRREETHGTKNPETSTTKDLS